jgi:hypothetical protein
MKNSNLLLKNQVNILNLNKLFLSSVTNLRDARCRFRGGFVCSVRNYQFKTNPLMEQFRDSYKKESISIDDSDNLKIDIT